MRLLACLFGVILVGRLFSAEKSGEHQPRKEKETNQASNREQPNEIITYRSTQSILRSVRPGLSQLYKDYALHFPGEEKKRGKVIAKILIAQNGHVLESKIIMDSMEDSLLAEKISAHFKSLKFKPTPKDVADTVRIPVDFPRAK